MTTVYVDTDVVGGDADGTSWANAYSTLSAAIGGLPDPLTDDYTIECRASSGTADTTAVTIGLSTTADYTLLIKPASSDDHDGTWQTSAYRLEQANGTALSITGGFGIVNNYSFEGLQIRLSSQSANYQTLINIGSYRDGTVKFERCLIRGANNTSYRARLIIVLPDNRFTPETIFVNNIIYDVQGTPSHVANAVFYVSSDFAPGPVYMYNNTIIGGAYLWYAAFGDFTGYDPINNIITAVDGTGLSAYTLGSPDYNMFDAAFDFGGANDENDLTFVFAGSGDYHLDSTDTGARGKGTDLSSDGTYAFSDDIDGDTRSAWDAGADEYVAAGGGLSGSVTESVTMADVPEATATLYASAVDSITMADVPTATGTYSASLTDSFEIDDTPAALLHLIGAMADGFQIDDAPTVTVTLYAQVSDGVAIGDICEITVPGVLSASLSDGITFTDTPVARSTLYGQAVDGITFADVVTGAFYIRGAVTDGITMADSAAMKRILSASATDGITFADLAASMAHLLAAAVDGVTIQDVTIAVGVEASGLMTMSATAKGAGITVTARVASMTVT